MSRAMGAHHSAKMQTDVWLTPPEILESLGHFDLDPCSPITRPWDTADKHYTINDDGLLQNWEGRVWLNPPYGLQAAAWLEKLAAHKNGTALIFARTDTNMFFDHGWNAAESMLFLRGRLHFHDYRGIRAKANSGAPSVLIAYDEQNAEMLRKSGIRGKHVYLKNNIFIVGIARDDKTWRVIVGEALTELGGDAKVQDVYKAVVELAPNKIRHNRNFKAKIRQTLQRYFERMERSRYRKTKLA